MMENTACKYHILKALVVRGDKLGYEKLKEDLNSDHFKIITKPISPFISKQNGFTNVNKMYTQRLFTVLYPSAKDSQIMMQLCGMVSLQMLENQGKLQELLPIAQETLGSGSSDIETKITALGLFRKILMQAI
jgi:hypothetical protein